MTQNKLKSFYSFEGNWFEIFESLVSLIRPTSTRRFAIWQSRIKAVGLLIVYGTRLPADWQAEHATIPVTEAEFQNDFFPKMNAYRIHGFNEFAKSKFGL